MVIQKKSNNLEDETFFFKVVVMWNISSPPPKTKTRNKKKKNTNERKGGGLLLDLCTFFRNSIKDNCRFYCGRMNVVEFRNEKGCKSTTALHSYEYAPGEKKKKKVDSSWIEFGRSHAQFFIIILSFYLFRKSCHRIRGLWVYFHLSHGKWR